MVRNVFNQELAEGLMAGFGLRLLSVRRGTGIPTLIARMATCAGRQDGRRDRIIEQTDPDLVVRFNSDWYDLAIESGLFAIDRQFLVALSPAIDPVFDRARDEADDWQNPAWWEYVWGLVELQENWDIAGAGAESGILGSAYGVPGFAMSATDGSVFVVGTRWEGSIGIAVVPMPYRSRTLRELARRNLDAGRTEEEKEDLRAWLAREEQP
jgi:hypothetical protein